MVRTFVIVAMSWSIAVHAQVRISQVYGGGGNAGSVWTHDFIELVNVGPQPVDLAGWSVRYASGAGSTWQLTPLAGIIPAMHYFLIAEAPGGGGTTPLPAPDVAGTIAMSASAGKVVLMSTQDPFSGGCPTGQQVIDLVGFGSAVTCHEGDSSAPPPGAKVAILRKRGGMTDTGNNGADFETGPPDPRNVSSTPLLMAVADLPAPVGPEPGLSCYPMPFNGVTRLRVTLARSGLYELQVMNILGEVVRVLARGYGEAGTKEFPFDAGDLPTGVYLCLLQGEGIRCVSRVILMR